ncbi:MAG: radical SAM protein [Thermodesulfobacteriota bacterium]|nr:radical SAM protein [Thermodesulfobacteriota bacterium]
MKDFPIKRIFIEKGADGYRFAKRIIECLGDIPVDRIESHDHNRWQEFNDMDKESIRLLRFQGAFLKSCPGTKEYICCGYQILNVGTNCPMDCSYCILQAYFNQPSVRVFVNLEKQLTTIAQVIDRRPEKIFRIGTGEFTDSLALDHIVRWSDILIPFFSKRKNAVLELKTKSDRIEGLLSSAGRDRVIISWSLNSPYIVAKEEHGTVGLKKRLEAAKRCQSEGFILGFHFDPLIEHPDWKERYLEALEMLDNYIDPKRIIWISMGCFRYMPGLKTIIRKRHPETHILDGEFILGLDGKMRYFKPIRIEMYGFMAEKIKKWYPDPGLYLCMESDEIWTKSMGWSPENSEGLSHYLDKRVIEFFG